MASKSSDETSGLHRLSEEQEKALEDTKQSQEKWEKYHSDYKALKTKLVSLPDKLTHNVLVPFGPLAFMPGKLVHTNEIMVLLGDNWFAERSAKQACEIIDRRIEAIDKQMKDLQDQWKLLESRRDFTDEFLQAAEAHGDFVEIKEDYDEEKEKWWRESHKQSVAAYRKRKHEDQTPEMDEDLMRRLEELELMEQEEEESSALEEEDEEDDEEESDDDDDDDEEGASIDNVIRFTHTHTPHEQLTSSHERTHSMDEASDTRRITSPADIYKLFPPQEEHPKSILKKSKSAGKAGKNSKQRVVFNTTEASDEILQETELSGASKLDDVSFDAKLAFSGEIVERNVVEKPKEKTSSEPAKRVSKFKQQRMQARR